MSLLAMAMAEIYWTPMHTNMDALLVVLGVGEEDVDNSSEYV